MAQPLEISLMGEVKISTAGRDISADLSQKARALFCYLVAEGETHSRHALAGLLWGDVPEEKAKNSLRVSLANLRKHLSPYLTITHLTLGINPEAPILVDIELLQNILHRSSTADLGELQRALDLYRGDFLTGLVIEDAPEFQEWLFTTRTYWQQRMLPLLSDMSTTLIEQRAFERAEPVLHRLLAIEPWHETAHRQLMGVMAQRGDLDGALAQYEKGARLLADTLGVEPMPETIALAEKIRRARDSQFGDIPAVEGFLIGREAEKTRLKEMLADPNCRLITICGMGGAGKTQLALTTAHEIYSQQRFLFLDGIVFLSLASVSRMRDLPLILADHLGLTLAGREDPWQQLAGNLRDKELLLVLDNVEQLISEGLLLNNLLEAGDGIKLLLTSREPLNLPSEWRLSLEGLDYQGDELFEEEVISSPAAELFLRTATRFQPEFKLRQEEIPDLGRLCALTAGVPLALKLAASSVKVMSVREMVDQMRQGIDLLSAGSESLPPRQQSMRVIVEQTVATLSPPAHTAAVALSVFHGSFDAPAAQEIAGTNLFVLAELVDRGMLQFDGKAIYQFHELLRQFLADQRPSSVDEAHGRYYLSWLVEVESRLVGKESRLALSELSAARANLQQAWRWAIHTRAWSLLAQAAPVLSEFYLRKGWFASGDEQFSELIDELKRTGRGQEQLLANCYVQKANFLLNLSQLVEAQQLANLVLDLADNPMIERAVADVKYILAHVNDVQGYAQQALDLALQALTYHQFAKTPPHHLSTIMNQVGHAYWGVQNAAQSLRWYDQAVEIALRADDPYSAVASIASAGSLRLFLGEYNRARADFLHLLRWIDEGFGVGYRAVIANRLGRVEIDSGNLSAARPFFEEALVLYERQQQVAMAALARNWLGVLARLEGDLVQAATLSEEALKVIEREGSRPDLLARVLHNQASILLAQEKPAEARKVLARCQAALSHMRSSEYYLMTLNLLHWATLNEGDLEAAAEILNEAFPLANDSMAVRLKLDFMVEMAHHLLQANHTEEAWRLMAFVHSQRQTAYETQLRISDLIETLPIMVHAPESRGDLGQTPRGMLATAALWLHLT
ncbi:MAG: BTAD domain-containing putative transcriptional regulator [Ardenticatenaceae bacterium]|nr:BTAD domain-containing putative transcriptional regulator [Ardenticatenaceae bacterium]